MNQYSTEPEYMEAESDEMLDMAKVPSYTGPRYDYQGVVVELQLLSMQVTTLEKHSSSIANQLRVLAQSLQEQS